MEERDQRAGGYMRNTQQIQMSSADDKECMVREQDRFMPIANVIRLMRRITPAHAKISDDAKETIQECVSEFISFITSEANMRCHQEQRKTITAEDLLWAMNNLGFDDYIEPLTFYLSRLREIETGFPLRGDPLLRRSMEHGATGIAPAFAPAYYMGPRSGFPGFMTMAQNAGSTTSGAGFNSLDTGFKWKQ